MVRRDSHSYLIDSTNAEKTGQNTNGHLGATILTDFLDVPLPQAILIDYLHVTLLRHTKTIIQNLYHHLRPVHREELDVRLKEQRFPHYFNRRMRAFRDLSYIKGIELKNTLFYGLIPLFINYLSIDRIAHLCLYVSGIRLIHSECLLGEDTHIVAGQLLKHYYKDHEKFYVGLQNFVLHLHRHYEQQYIYYGALSNTSTFAQEDLIGCKTTLAFALLLLKINAIVFFFSC